MKNTEGCQRMALNHALLARARAAIVQTRDVTRASFGGSAQAMERLDKNIADMDMRLAIIQDQASAK